MNLVVIFFFIWRAATVFISFIAQKTVPYLGFFPYKEMLSNYHLPFWLSSCANFDGVHYLRIAEQGYAQYEQAFFPLYPLLIKFFAFFFGGNSMTAALVISTACFFVGFILFYKLLLKIQKEENVLWILVFLLSFPTAFYFGAIYTEGLFFMLVVASLYFLKEKKYVYAGICALLSSTTRLIGIFLVIPFFLSLIKSNKNKIKKINIQSILLLLSPCIGLFVYMAYLWGSTGDPLIFFNSQPKFGANRSTHLILLPQVYYRYFKIVFTAAHNFQWVMSVVEMCFFSLIFFVLVLDLFSIAKGAKTENKPFLLGLNLFSFATILLPSLTGTFSSIPRYSLFSFSFFLYLGKMKSTTTKTIITVLFLTGQIVLLSLFIQGYFVG